MVAAGSRRAPGPCRRLSETSPAIARKRFRSLKRRLQINEETFPHNRLRAAISAWRFIGANLTILGWIHQGFKIPFISTPPPFDMGNSRFEGAALKQWEETLPHYLRLGALRPASYSSHVSWAFMIPKPDGTLRLIIDLRPLNAYIEDRRMKMQTLRDLEFNVHRGDWMVSWDIADAYFHVALRPEQVRFCTIRVNGRLWELPVLPFGLKSSPYVFTKVMKPFLNFLRSPRLVCPRPPPPHWSGLRALWRLNLILYLLSYLDDFLGVHKNRFILATWTHHLRQALHDLGISLKEEKSVLNPVQGLKELGLWVDSHKGRFEVPWTKVQAIQTAAHTLLAIASHQARWFSQNSLPGFLDKLKRSLG